MGVIEFDDFLKVEMHVGRIVEAESFPEARKPAYKLKVDFGAEIGIKKTSAQITELYSLEDLIGKIVVGVTNFPPKQIGKFFSEVLILGAHDKDGKVALLEIKLPVPLGTRIS